MDCQNVLACSLAFGGFSTTVASCAPLLCNYYVSIEIKTDRAKRTTTNHAVIGTRCTVCKRMHRATPGDLVAISKQQDEIRKFSIFSIFYFSFSNVFIDFANRLRPPIE